MKMGNVGLKIDWHLYFLIKDVKIVAYFRIQTM